MGDAEAAREIGHPRFAGLVDELGDHLDVVLGQLLRPIVAGTRGVASDRDAAGCALRRRGRFTPSLDQNARIDKPTNSNVVYATFLSLDNSVSYPASPLCLASALLCQRTPRRRPPTPAPPPPPERTTAISGYMDFHFNKHEFADGRLDFHRFVLLITHSFSDRIRFVSELELEHALVEGLEEAGELELEQAYVDFLLSRRFNVRAGMMLVPVGIINERHEPPVYYGVERPFVDTVIIPTTWFEVGAGVHGEIGRGWRYRALCHVAAERARVLAPRKAFAAGGRRDRTPISGGPASPDAWSTSASAGLTVGASFWTGRSGFEFRPRFDVPVTLGEADVRYSRDRLELRGQFAQVAISNAGAAERRDGARGWRGSERGERAARVLRARPGTA